MNTATSLQLAWTKCAKETVKARAWIQLVGEPISVWRAVENKPEENPDEAIFQLSIKMGDNPEYPKNKVPLFTVAADEFLYKKDDNDKFIYPACFLDDRLPMFPVPKFWTINSGNTQINGKHLLVFHLLPQKATRVFDEKGVLQNDQPPEMPKCKGKLSIIFENVAGLLQSSGLPPPTTSTISTTTETGSSDRTTEGNATNATAAPGGGIGIGIILAIVGGVVLLLVVVAVLVWFFCCRGKEEDDNEEDAEAGGADTEKETDKESAQEEGAEAEKESAKEEGADEDVPVPAE